MEYGAWVGLGCFIGMLLFIFLGVPIFMSMIATSLVGFWLIGGSSYAFQQFSTGPYFIIASYSLAVIPLFILMGILAADAKLAEGTYWAAYKWVGGLRGGLLMSTIAAGVLFGACSGSGLAMAAIFAKLAIPELDKYKYDKSISMGCIATSAGLDALIPPSVGIIIFCVLLDQSIGRALVGGIVPGILYAVLLMVTIWIIGIFKPQAIPKSDIQVNWKEKFKTLKLIGPVLFLFILVMGGMFAGVFAPTVGGAIGSVGVILYALVTRIKIRTLVSSFYETALVNAQIFLLALGGFIFARLVALSGLPNGLIKLMTDANLSPLLLMVIVCIFYLFIGCFLDFVAMAIITFPIVFPMLLKAGFDPIAMIIILIILGNIAGITPPIGINAFVIASVAKVKPEEVFRGVGWFFVVSLILVWILVFIPEIVTWLPNLFYGKISP
jgi:tripartite ATP-independent transporter DctM subunit